MAHPLELEELVEHFTLYPDETRLLRNKSGATRLGFVPTPVVNDWIDGVAARYAYLEEAQLEEHHYAEIRTGQARGDG